MLGIAALTWTAIGNFLWTGLVGAVVKGALVGAAIGGISALVMDGDVGKGMLYGAIGGAVTAGIGYGLSSMGGASGGAAGAGGDGVITLGAEGQVASKTAAGGLTGPDVISGGAGGGTGGFQLSEGLQEAMAEGGISTVGSMIQGSAAQDAADRAAKLAAEQRAVEREHEMAMLQAKLSGDSGGGSDALGVARIGARTADKDRLENARQYNEQLAVAEAARTRAGQSAERNKQRRGRFSALGGSSRTVEEQVFENSSGVYEEAPTVQPALQGA